MSKPGDPSRDLLFGLLALQNGLIEQGGLFTAFAAWTRDKGRPLADHLANGGGLDVDDRLAVEAMVARHLSKHGNDVERSLAAIPAGRSTREGLAAIGEPAIEASVIRIGSAATRDDDEADQTANYSVGTATSDGLRFRILRPHAQGGLGAVFVALDGELNREVALKQILEKHADDPVSRGRFLLEAEVTGGLEHPGIVPVYGLGAYSDGRPYYAMRFIKGDSLKEAIDRFHAGKSESWRSRPAVARAAQAAAALYRRVQRDRVRAFARRAASGHQARQYHRRAARRDVGGRLGPGQSHRQIRPVGRRADADALLGQRLIRDVARLGPGDPGLHEPGAGRRELRRARAAERRLQLGALLCTAC